MAPDARIGRSPGADDSVALFGRSLTDVRRLTGSLAQLAGIEHFRVADGPGDGARRIRVRSGGGLELDIHPDRGFDLGRAVLNGVPLVWVGPRGTTEVRGEGDPEFTTAFSGGLLFTCGLDSFGPASDDADRHYPQHGAVWKQQAELRAAEVDEDHGLIVLVAEVVQSSLFGENFLLRRRLELPIGGTEVRLFDTVTNRSDRDRPHMILYHSNFGWPLVDADATISRTSGTTTAVNEPARLEGAAGWRRLDAPSAGYEERVFLHTMDHTIAESSVTVANPRLGLSARVSFATQTLPYAFEWKMAGVGTYVLGVEPANSPDMSGRAVARSHDNVSVLGTGQSVSYRLRYEFTTDAVARGASPQQGAPRGGAAR